MRIAKLTPSQRKQGRWLVQLENGEILRVGENEVVAFALGSGMELEEETLQALCRAAKTSELKEYALNTLTVRAMSCFELRQKLEQKGADPLQAGEITGRLKELGYLDDALYAANLVRHCAAKGYGPYKIKDELFRRGVPREYWDEALEQQEDPSEAIDALIAKKLKQIENPDRKDLKRVSDALARRGYSWSDISAALRRWGADVEE